jgi:hypothetical protein
MFDLMSTLSNTTVVLIRFSHWGLGSVVGCAARFQRRYDGGVATDDADAGVDVAG